MEKDLLLQCELFELTLQQAGQSLDPSTLSMYLFQLAQSFNSFYAALSISNAETEEKKTTQTKNILFGRYNPKIRNAIAWYTGS